MFLMQDQAELKKQEKQEYMLMEKILKEQKMEQQDQMPDGAKDFKDSGKPLKRKKSNKKIEKNEEGIKKQGLSTKITKKNEVEKALKNFIAPGIKFVYDKIPSQEQYREMTELTDAPQFTLNYRVFLGKILRVVDGDTVKVALKLSGVLTRFTFRLGGVDTPESRSGEVKQFGQYVKQLLRRMLEGKIVKVQAGQFDKYGRGLARIYAFSQNQQFCVNDFLIQNQLAKPYEGKTKDQFGKKDYQLFKKKYTRSQWPQVVNYPRIYFNEGKAS